MDEVSLNLMYHREEDFKFIKKIFKNKKRRVELT